MHISIMYGSQFKLDTCVSLPHMVVYCMYVSTGSVGSVLHVWNGRSGEEFQGMEIADC